MNKIVPIYIHKNGDNLINSIVGISTGRIHNDIRVQKIGDQLYTKIRYYLDPDKDATETLLIMDSPVAIYREMDFLAVGSQGAKTLDLVGGGTVSVAPADIIYCYLDDTSYERCSIDVISGSRRTLYNIDMTFMALLAKMHEI